MICTNCGSELPKGVSFCTNCGAAVPVDLPDSDDGASLGEVSVESLGSSLEAAVEANKQEMDSIEARAQAQVDAAFSDFPKPDADAPEAPLNFQKDASPNAHYSSQRSYDGNAYGQNNGQAHYQQSYQQPSSGTSEAQQQTWYSQPVTSRAFAMTLYLTSPIGFIIGLCVRDRDDEFITHHINNALVIFIGGLIGMMLSIVLIGGILLLYLFVMTIIGMVSAYNGDTRELPLIGKIRIIS